MYMFSWANVYVLDSINSFLSLHGGQSDYAQKKLGTTWHALNVGKKMDTF